MAFDIGIDFRGSAGYVTDPANCTYNLSETYPVTRGGATFGWIDVAAGNGRDRSITIDPRLAGIAYRSGAGATKMRFQLDLPASGSVDIYCAIGDQTGGNNGYLEIFDNTTSLGVLVTKHAGVPAGNFYDATDTLHLTANWPAANAKSTLTFSTTTLIAAITPGDSLGGNYTIAHLRAVQAASGSTGTVSYTNVNDTSAASGTTTVTGSLATTNSNDTVAASGSPIVAGSSDTANADDTCAASGTVGSSVSGSISSTNADDTSAASGTTTVTGTLAQTNANDTSAASGTTTVTGSSATTNADDACSASGTVETVTVMGTVAYTNADDTASASGTTTIVGSVAATNANDTATASGVINNGIVVETSLTTGIAETIRIKKPGIPAGTPDWLRTTLEILIGRRGNAIDIPKHQTLTFSATPTKAECEALYSYVNEIRTSLEDLINRFDT